MEIDEDPSIDNASSGTPSSSSSLVLDNVLDNPAPHAHAAGSSTSERSRPPGSGDVEMLDAGPSTSTGNNPNPATAVGTTSGASGSAKSGHSQDASPPKHRNARNPRMGNPRKRDNGAFMVGGSRADGMMGKGLERGERGDWQDAGEMTMRGGKWLDEELVKSLDFGDPFMEQINGHHHTPSTHPTPSGSNPTPQNNNNGTVAPPASGQAPDTPTASPPRAA